MGVIINDFEIVPEPPPGNTQDGAETPAPATPSLSPQEIRDIIRHYDDRMMRLRAT